MKTEGKNLRILHLEDDPDDTEIIKFTLDDEGRDCTIIHVVSENEFTNILKKDNFDIILADYNLPDFDGISALTISRRIRPEIPFIFVSGSIGEEKAIEVLKAGATDYVLKDNLKRLVPSIDRAIEVELERKRRVIAKKELKEAKKYTDNIIKSIAEALIVVNRELNIISVNDAAAAMLQSSVNELKGSPLSQVLSSECTGFLDNSGGAENIWSGVAGESEMSFLDKGGKEIPVSVLVSSLMDDNDKIEGFVFIARDMRQSRLLKDLEKSNRELKETTSQLIQSEKLSALGEMAAGIAHELSQPLYGIHIITQSILRGCNSENPDSETLREDVDDILQQVKRMSDIIDHMRLFARDTEEAPRMASNINTVVTGPFKLVGQLLKKQDIEIEAVMSDNLPDVIINQIQIEQVLLNLITNAKNSLIRCCKEDKKISVKTYETLSPENKPCVVVEVCDNGDGIKEEIKDKIFQPFFTTSKPGKGTGIGLSISNKIIESHNGKIELHTVMNEGSSFKVILPAQDRL